MAITQQNDFDAKQESRSDLRFVEVRLYVYGHIAADDGSAVHHTAEALKRLEFASEMIKEEIVPIEIKMVTEEFGHIHRLRPFNLGSVHRQVRLVGKLIFRFRVSRIFNKLRLARI
jgi:hypothetical protein